VRGGYGGWVGSGELERGEIGGGEGYEVGLQGLKV